MSVHIAEIRQNVHTFPFYRSDKSINRFGDGRIPPDIKFSLTNKYPAQPAASSDIFVLTEYQGVSNHPLLSINCEIIYSRQRHDFILQHLLLVVGFLEIILYFFRLHVIRSTPLRSDRGSDHDELFDARIRVILWRCRVLTDVPDNSVTELLQSRERNVFCKQWSCGQLKTSTVELGQSLFINENTRYDARIFNRLSQWNFSYAIYFYFFCCYLRINVALYYRDNENWHCSSSNGIKIARAGEVNLSL